MKMKALKDFRGQAGEGTSPAHGDRFVEAGAEFNARDEARGAWLERHGLAIPAASIEAALPEPREAEVKNPAAETGPLPSAGGKIGGKTPRSSSPAVPAPKTPRSAKPKAAAKS